jgi:hypothetical protein
VARRFDPVGNTHARGGSIEGHLLTRTNGLDDFLGVFAPRSGSATYSLSTQPTISASRRLDSRHPASREQQKYEFSALVSRELGTRRKR